MNEYIRLKKSNCKNCHKCIRHCPVKSIRFSAGQAHVVTDECILCGQCFVNCPQEAKHVRNDVEKAKVMLMEEETVIASIAPSFIANYSGAGIEAMRAALKALGFYDAEETAVGASLVKTEYERLLRGDEKKALISSCCHTVNLLIQKYFPEALPYLAPVISPMLAHSQDIKKRYPNAKTVFIGPCISKKAEAEMYGGVVDLVLTFEELTQWLGSAGVSIAKEAEAVTPNSKARLFPVTGGIIKTMNIDESHYDFLPVDGVENCINVIKEVISGSISGCFIEMSACTGSCVGGPVMDIKPEPVSSFLKVNHYAGKLDFELPQPGEKELHRRHGFIGLNRKQPGRLDIDMILAQMGKTRPEDELNCGTCGYDTCRDKAAAVYQGKADVSMCLPFIKERAESFSDNIIKNTPNAIIVTNERLEIQQINEAAMRLLGIRNRSDVVGDQAVRILDVENFIEVQQGGKVANKHMYLAEYKKHVEQTIVYDKEYHIFICIMRDVTDVAVEREEKERLSRETAKITDEVVEKQMRVVQEIAYLLGETAAETKVALTKLKETLKHE